jgi:hypothetical protein
MPLAAQPWMFWYRTSMHVVSSASWAESLLTVTVGPASGTFIVTVGPDTSWTTVLVTTLVVTTVGWLWGCAAAVVLQAARPPIKAKVPIPAQNVLMLMLIPQTRRGRSGLGPTL